MVALPHSCFVSWNVRQRTITYICCRLVAEVVLPLSAKVAGGEAGWLSLNAVMTQGTWSWRWSAAREWAWSKYNILLMIVDLKCIKWRRMEKNMSECLNTHLQSPKNGTTWAYCSKESKVQVLSTKHVRLSRVGRLSSKRATVLSHWKIRIHWNRIFKLDPWIQQTYSYSSFKYEAWSNGWSMAWSLMISLAHWPDLSCFHYVDTMRRIK